MKIFALTVAVLATVATSATADARRVRSISGERWQAICDHQPVRCDARLLGEIDGVITGMRLTKGKPWICMPDNVDDHVRRAVVERYLDRYPEALSASFGEGVAAALAKAYPCH